MKYKLKIIITLVIVAQFIVYPVILAESENKIELNDKPAKYSNNSLGHFKIKHYNFYMFLLLEKVTNLIHVNYTEPISKDYYFNRTEDGKILMNFTIDVTHSRNSGRGWLPFIKRFTGFDIYIADTSLWPDLDYFNITNIKECKSPTLETYTIQIESNNQLNDLHLDEGENESLKVMIYPFYQITSKSPPFFSKQPIELEIKIYSKQP